MTTARTWVRLGIVTSTVVAACKFTHGELQDGSIIDIDAPPVCADASTTCAGDKIRMCSGAGATPIDTLCGWGCMADPTPRCAQLVPSGGGVRPADVTGAGLEPKTFVDITIDGDFGRIGTTADPELFHSENVGVENGIDFQVRGSIATFRFSSLTISGTLSLVGQRPIALVADGDITINGVIDARGGCLSSIAGPGGFTGGTAQGSPGLSPVGQMGGGEGAPSAASGGGGGAYGANGGNAKTAGGGVPFGDAEISTLFGGGGGGAGADSGAFGVGGGGGGALQLISNSKIVIASGGLNASGCGGKAGTGGSESGGGGGAGGALLLEAPEITIAGTLAVNGGGGGGGGGAGANPGTKGSLDRTIAPAGDGDGVNEDGGSGAAGGMGAGSGGSGANPGGGGGAIGRIRFNTKSDLGLVLDAAAVLSPAFNDANTTCTRGPATVQ